MLCFSKKKQEKHSTTAPVPSPHLPFALGQVFNILKALGVQREKSPLAQRSVQGTQSLWTVFFRKGPLSSEVEPYVNALLCCFLKQNNQNTQKKCTTAFLSSQQDHPSDRPEWDVANILRFVSSVASILYTGNCGTELKTTAWILIWIFNSYWNWLGAWLNMFNYLGPAELA